MRMPDHHGNARYFSGKVGQCLLTRPVKPVAQQQVFRRITTQAEFGSQQ